MPRKRQSGEITITELEIYMMIGLQYVDLIPLFFEGILSDSELSEIIGQEKYNLICNYLMN